MTPISEATQDAIKKAASDTLAPLSVANVSSKPDTDHDGDDIIVVVVTFDSTNAVLDGEKLLAASVKIQDALTAHGEQRFAHVQFVSSDDLGGEIE